MTQEFEDEEFESIVITNDNRQELAERFGVEDDWDAMLPLGYVMLTVVGDNDDYDLIYSSN